MTTTSIRIEGLKGVLATLQSLPSEIVSKRGGPVRFALRKAALVIRDEAQANVQKIIDAPNKGNLPSESTGLLKKAIVVSRGKQPTAGNGETMLVKIKRGAFYPDQSGRKLTAAKVGRLLEYGSERRAPMPWLRPAFEAKKQQAVDTFTAEILKRIGAIVKKLAKQNGVRD